MIEPRVEIEAMMRLSPGHDLETVQDRISALLRRPAWQARAACRGADPATFFLDKGGDPRPAKALCAACEVSAECLSYAAETGAEGGIWGGVSARKITSGGKRAA